jgi:hypothetical protein
MSTLLFSLHWGVIIVAIVAQLWVFVKAIVHFYGDKRHLASEAEAWCSLAADFARSGRVSPDESGRFHGLEADEIQGVFDCLSERGDLVAGAPPAIVAPPDVLTSTVGNLASREVLPQLPALGLLGTFIGVAFTLYDVKVDANSALDISLMIGEVQSAMSVAFVTSITGLLFYLFAVWWHDGLAVGAERARRQSKSEFLKNVRIVSPAVALARLDSASFQRAAEALATASLDLQKIVGSLGTGAANLAESATGMQTASRLMSHAITENIAPFGQQIGEFAATSATFSSLVGDLIASNKRSDETSQKLATSVADLSKVLRSGVEDAVASLQVAMSRLRAESEQASATFRETWSRSVGESLSTLQSVAKSFGTMDQDIQRTALVLDSTLKLFHGRAEAFDGAMATALQLMTEIQRVSVMLENATEMYQAASNELLTQSREGASKFFEEAGGGVADLVDELNSLALALHAVRHSSASSLATSTVDVGSRTPAGGMRK